MVTGVTAFVSYDCGCGGRYNTWQNAEAHARATGHSLTIHGRVVAEKDEPPPYVPAQRLGKRQSEEDN